MDVAGVVKAARAYTFLEQIDTEIIELATLVYRLKPKVVLEIGTNQGGTLFIFARVAPTNAILISLDINPKAKSAHDVCVGKQEAHDIRASSHVPATRRTLESILNGRKVDFLYIDANHDYPDVKADFYDYAPYVRRGGIIAFHDIVSADPVHPISGVTRFWPEIKDQYYSLSIIHLPGCNWDGEGILVWPGKFA